MGWLVSIAVVLLVLAVGFALRIVSKRSGSHPAGTPTTSTPAISPTGDPLTLENFRRLRYGMTYDQVVSIMGPPRFDGVDSYSNGRKSRNIGWTNGHDTVSVQFFDDANRANVVCATFDRVNYNAPKP
jgi:hypothetical protein